MVTTLVRQQTVTQDGQATSTLSSLRFYSNDRFRRVLRQRVDEHFASTGRRRRDCPSMYLKTAIVLACLGASYTLLVFAPVTWWQAVPLIVLLGLSLAALGFNVQHDGGHRAYSERPWINKLAALTLDMAGASSYVWARKHNSIHHSFTNVTGHDNDIDIGLLGRLSPHQQRRWFHRLQHLYLWFFYGLLPLKWHLLDDFRCMVTGRIGAHRLPRPRGWDMLTLLGGKVVFFALAFGLPLSLHPWWQVLSVYAATTFLLGVVLSVVFQLAHCVEQAEFPLPSTDTGRMVTTWAEHQVQTTVDFAQRNRPLTWFLGGLNFQIEHHLFPQICHVHYPALALLVQETCRDFGLRYAAQRTLRASIASHFRWLRRMGLADSTAEESSPGALSSSAVTT